MTGPVEVNHEYYLSNKIDYACTYIYRTCSQIKTLWAALVFVFKGDKHWVNPKREKKNWPGAV